MDAIKSKENPTTFDKFAIEASGDHKKQKGYYRKTPTIEELPKILNETHSYKKPFKLSKYIRLYSRYS